MTRSLVGPIIQRHDSAVVDNEEHYLRTLSKHQRQFSAHHGIVLSTFGFSRMEIVQCTESVWGGDTTDGDVSDLKKRGDLLAKSTESFNRKNQTILSSFLIRHPLFKNFRMLVKPEGDTPCICHSLYLEATKGEDLLLLGRTTLRIIHCEGCRIFPPHEIHLTKFEFSHFHFPKCCCCYSVQGVEWKL